MNLVKQLVYQNELELFPLAYDLGWLIEYFKSYASIFPTGRGESMVTVEEMLMDHKTWRLPMLRKSEIDWEFSRVAENIVRRAAAVELDSHLPKVDTLKNENGNDPSVKYRTWLYLRYHTTSGHFKPATAYQGLAGALQTWTATFMSLLQVRLHELIEQIVGRHLRVGRWVAIAITHSKKPTPDYRERLRIFTRKVHTVACQTGLLAVKRHMVRVLISQNPPDSPGTCGFLR